MTEERSWAEYEAVLNGANDMRFDYVWNEELWVYECQQAAERGRERVVTDGEW